MHGIPVQKVDNVIDPVTKLERQLNVCHRLGAKKIIPPSAIVQVVRREATEGKEE